MKHIFPYSILTIINIITTDSTLICFTIHKLLQYPKQYYANTFLIFFQSLCTHVYFNHFAIRPPLILS